ncbi:MAG: hypothetical protein JST06_10205, partial [Bacteroidetes bacterium]|nr:hypothetical protein [Bacteroidota bacterium]
MCQWLYLPGDFNSTPPGNVFITTIYIKPGSTGSYSYTNMLLKLGNTSLTTLTSGTWNSGLTTVYNPSSVTISTTNNSWLSITLSTPFLYTGGGLLFEASHQNSGGIGTGFTINQYSVSGRNGRMYGVPTSTSSSGADNATALFGFDCIPAACSGMPSAGTITNAAMNTATPLCAGGTMTLTGNSTNLGNGITYMWQSASSSTGPFSNVTNGSGSGTLSYTTGAVFSNTWYRLAITCTNSSLTSYSAPYQVITGSAQPSAISGNPTFCPGDISTYSVSNVPGSTYTWTLPAGWTGSSSNSSITVTAGSSPGTISVLANSSCGTSIARTKSIAAGGVPATPGAISGAQLVCKNASMTYSVAPVAGALSYQWTLPSGWSGSSTTNSITIMPDTNSGNIMVRAINNCGLSQPNSRAITVINSLSSPGTIISSSSGSYCGGKIYSFRINSVPGATSYVWNYPSGWSGTNSDTAVQVYAGNSGQVTVTAYASCATSPSSSLSIT